jgi:hypothetical protein
MVTANQNAPAVAIFGASVVGFSPLVPGAADPLVASVFHIREIPSWAELFSNYLLSGDFLSNEAEARRL